MEYKSIKELQYNHLGEDIYVICAGPSSNFIEPSFFEYKTVIGVNNVFKKFS